MATDVKQAARKFREFWTLAKDSEVGGYQKFWLSMLADVLGMDDVMSRISFQSPVQLKDTTKFLDAWIPETRVLIEHKARNVKLDAPQAGHDGKTPFEQALDYNIARPYSEKARWIVTCNFLEIWVYDMDHPLEDPQKILLANLPKEISRLGFLVDTSVKTVREKEMDISIKAGRIVGDVYRALRKRYADPDSAETLKALNRLCVRLVFCFYAEDADIFPKDALWTLLKNTESKNLRRALLTLFRTLDTPDGSNGTKNERDPYLEPEVAVFPYTNGGLFSGVSDAEIPPLDDDIKELLIKSANFDWRDISPTIFGALFESTLNPETRRAGGMVYTSVENIHKVIDPLFMNDLTAELESIKSERAIAVRSAKAMSFQEKLGSLTFLDPACGSGNFLTETFLSLRKLENEAIVVGERLKPGEVLLNLDGIVKVSIKQFHGIEINDFAVSVAKTAMWISEAKMLNETANILHAPPKYLPLHDYDGIVEGNALRMDWGGLLTQRRGEAEGAEGGLAAKNAENAKSGFDYIMGNPPFIGARNKTSEQAADMESVFGGKWSGLGNLDYVTAWYKKAVDCVLAAKDAESTKAAFVSTNSICQGDSVATLWMPLFEKGLEIDFAHRTFRWDNESFEKAHVHCVIVGFHVGKSPAAGKTKTIFDNDKAIPAAHINGYLMDAHDIWIEGRTKPICKVSEINYGSFALDDGNYTIKADEYAQLKKEDADIDLFLREFVGAQELIHSKKRYCVWLRDISPALIHSHKLIYDKVQKVKEWRSKSSRKNTLALASTPTLFAEVRQPDTSYLAIPTVCSEKREYIPIAFLPATTIASNQVYVLPSATLYHFGVLTSSVHMAWMRVVAGRLEMRYRYSAAIVYNNFPWPALSDSAPLREKISQTAQAILDVRGKYPDSSLADLYDPLTMPADLRAAHAANDRAVLAAYGLKPDTPEPEIIAHIFKLYAEKTDMGSN